MNWAGSFALGKAFYFSPRPDRKHDSRTADHLADFPEKLLDCELAAREQCKRITLLKLATLSAVKTLEQIDWTAAACGAPKRRSWNCRPYRRKVTDLRTSLDDPNLPQPARRGDHDPARPDRADHPSAWRQGPEIERVGATAAMVALAVGAGTRKAARGGAALGALERPSVEVVAGERSQLYLRLEESARFQNAAPN